MRVLLLYAASPEARRLTYQGGWPKHFVRHPRFECLPVNVLSRFRRVPRRQFDAVVILHSVFSNGCYLLEPRVLVPPRAISARTMKMIEQSAGNLKKGRASAPIDDKQRAQLKMR